MSTVFSPGAVIEYRQKKTERWRGYGQKGASYYRNGASEPADGDCALGCQWVFRQSRVLGSARTGVNRYVEQTYSHLDLHTERFGHDFKTGGYYAYLCSESSGDAAFYVCTDMLGRIRQDSFDIWVAHKYNTELRIREEYRLLADAVFQAGTIPYALDFVLRTPMPEDGSPGPDTAVYARILYEDIKDEGMEERVRESHEAIVEEYAQLDEEKAMGSTSED